MTVLQYHKFNKLFRLYIYNKINNNSFFNISNFWYFKLFSLQQIYYGFQFKNFSVLNKSYHNDSSHE